MSQIRPGFGLTFDDVLLVPRHSSVHPRNVSTATRFTRNIPLNIPLVAAAMDTVTESEMAIAMARAGGIGVLHKNMSIDRQAAEVDRVKRSESGMIMNPITLGAERPIREAHALMRRFRISGVPIVDGAGRLIGIITNRDLQFESNLERPIAEAMTREGLITTPVGTTLAAAEAILAHHKIEKLPVVDDAGVLKGLITVKDIFKRRDFPDANKDTHGRVARGGGRWRRRRGDGSRPCAGDSGCRRDRGGLGARPFGGRARDDCRPARGFSRCAACRCATLRPSRVPGALVERGVDAVKVGIGPGSICTTRVVTGVGVPQLTAIIDAVAGAGDIPVIADGGIKYSGRHGEGDRRGRVERHDGVDACRHRGESPGKASSPKGVASS